MKEMLKKTLSLMLAAALVFGICGNGLFVLATESGAEETKINYVSLGESMTNGYGTEGYYPGYDLDTHGYLPAEYIDRIDVLEKSPGQSLGGFSSAADGLSNTFGRDQKNVTTYASEFAKYLETVYGEGNVNWQPWAISGQRPEDFYWLMQENWKQGMDAGHDEGQTLFEEDGTYNGDMYTTAIWKNGNANEARVSRFLASWYGRFSYRFADWNNECTKAWTHDSYWADYYYADPDAEAALEEFRDLYIETLANADVISINLGTHCFAANVSSQIHEVLANDPKQYLYEDELRNDPQALLEVLPEEYGMIYDSIMEIIDEELANIIASLDGDEWIEEKIDTIKNIYAYATLSFITTYDLSLQRIREINPDAEIIVLGMTNFQEGLTFVTDDGDVVDFGKLFGLLVEFTNLYRAVWVEDAKDCVFVPPVEDMHLLIDEFAAGETNVIFLAKIVANLGFSYEVSNEWCNKYLNPHGWYGRPEGACQDAVKRQSWTIEYLHNNGAYFPEGTNEVDQQYLVEIKKVYDHLRAIAAVETFDFEESIALVSGTESVTMPDAMANIGTDKEVPAGYQMVAHYWIRCFMGEGVGCHPSVTGHKQVAEKMIECYENNYTGTDYVIDKVTDTVKEAYNAMMNSGMIDPDAIRENLDVLIEELNVIYGDLEGEFIDEIKATYADVESLLEALNAAYKNATTGDYVVSKDSYYVSIGDSTTTGLNTGDAAYGNYGYKTKVPSSFTYKLAEALGLNVDTQYAQLAMAGLRPADIRYILDETYVPDAYALDRTIGRINAYAGGLEQMRADYFAELSKADLITISMGSCNFSDFISAQEQGMIAELLNEELADFLDTPYLGAALKQGISQYIDLDSTTYEMNWENYIGEDGMAALEATLEAIKAEAYAQGVPEYVTIDVAEMLELPSLAGVLVVDIPVVDMIAFVAECYLYAYVTFAMDYAEVYNLVHEIAPDAEMVIVGMYNAADDVVINYEDYSIAFGDYYGYFTNAINLHHLCYAMLTPNTTFVSVPETESNTDAALAENGYVYELLEYVLFNIELDFDCHATAAGHEYIKDQIMNALNVTHAVVLGDVNGDGKVNTTDARLIMQYTLDLVDETGLDLAAADVNGDGKVSTTDARLIMQLALNIITEFPVK